MNRTLSLAATALAALAGPGLVRAHHGTAAVSVAGPEGPGAALETTSPLPLPKGTLFTMMKAEYVPFRKFAFAEPENKDYSSFNMFALGFGIRPWLSAYVFQPLNVKVGDGIGRNSGAGDPNLMLAFGFKYDEGFRLVPEKESLDELLDWHFSVSVSSTIPLATTGHTDRAGAFFAPDMQLGFGAPAPGIGIAVMKQASPDLTFLTEVNYQHFFPHTYQFTRYQFGGETRINTAAVYRVYGRGSFRFDVAGELNFLHLQRDEERNDAGEMEALQASGGGILYAGLGTRLFYGPFSAAVGIRRAALKELNEGPDQQGSEGLEKFRLAATLSYSTRF
ncbi:MAG: hypothetical protein A2V77_04155 [Anaeromyxobacter sp. RBG_16_69_14]|nr:MAG: hypothetical protein A2V77_04155 [Anaeromyxobacter sp. RBG_16_69_14]